jgi:hypothetical protein
MTLLKPCKIRAFEVCQESPGNAHLEMDPASQISML